MRRTLARLSVTAVLGSVVSGSAAQTTTITLLPVARVTGGAGVRLAQVADVDGPEADRLGAVVVLPADGGRASAVGGRVSLTVAQVREALDREAVNWGQVALRGSTCSVRLREADGRAKPTDAAARAAPAAAPEPVDLSGPPTVRTHVVASLAALFNVEPADLRLRFRPEDEMLLTTPTTARRVDAQAAASAASPRIPVQVFVYAGDRVVAAGTVTVEALVRREVLTASAPIERGRAIGPEAVSASLKWIGPNTTPPASRERVVGSVARHRIAAGAIITDADLEAPLAAKRGELVWVHCLSGSVTVKAKARTLADARDGELVPLRMDGSKKTFTARMSGPGTAVMDLSE